MYSDYSNKSQTVCPEVNFCDVKIICVLYGLKTTTDKIDPADGALLIQTICNPQKRKQTSIL